MIVTEHLPPLQMVENGEVVGGLATEIVKAMLRQAGSQVNIRPFIWARSYKMALERENIMIYSITRNIDREAKFKWVGALLKLDNYLWRVNDRKDIKVRELKDAKKYRIAVP